MSAQKKGVMFTVVVLLALVALMAGLLLSQRVRKPKRIDTSQFHGTVLQAPRKVQAFSFLGIDNKTFDNQAIEGQWVLVFFGFTSCGYVCPTTMAELGKMYTILEQKKIKRLPQVVMISIDPERDSLDKLKQYVKAFNLHFYGARGDKDAIDKITREMGIAYAKIALPGQNAQNYDIQHSGTVVLFNPKGELSAFFTPPLKAEWIAQDYALLAA